MQTTLKIAAVLLYISTFVACAGDMHVKPPDSWVHGSRRDIPDPELRRGFRDLLLCHPEPYSKLNTSVLVVVNPGPATAFIERYISGLKARAPELTVLTPIQASSLAGQAASYTEVEYSVTSPIDSSRVSIHTGLWAIPKGSHVVAVFAQQPTPPDPGCTSGLDDTLATLRIE